MMLLWLIILFIIIDNSEATDPCYNYTAINEDARSASVEFDTTVINATLCDQFLKEGWYRSIGPAGGEMPNSCPALMRCSTAGPIWINMPEADKPPANTTVTKTACASDFLSCCSNTYSIDVRNCFDVFYIYRLVPTTRCPQAYCFGIQAPCPAGQSSETGYTPGCGSYPTLNVTGTVVPGLRTRDQYEGRSNLYYEEVQFECEFTPNDTQDYAYDVFWYINDKTIPITSFLKVKKENLSSSVLLEEHWKSKHRMNMVVWCSTRVRQNDASSPSPFFWSHGFTAGIKFDKDAYDVKESESIEIGLELTVPLPCQKRSSATHSSLTNEFLTSLCVLNLLITVPVYQTDSTKTCNADGTSIDPDGLVFKNAKCGVYFTASDWSSRSFLNVTGKVDSLYNLENRITSIRLNPSYYIQDSVWTDLILPDIKVAVIDSDHQVTGKMCRSFNDPHITPFQKLSSSFSYYYDHFIIGEYILFKSTRFPYQVNAMFRTCNRRATCHCGIAVKNADGLFVINMCPQNLAYISSSPTNRYVEKRFCDDTHMTMRQEGSAYRVTLPTGTDIVINIGGKYINSVIIKPSVLDYNTTVGLCGHFGFDNIGEYILLNKTFTSNLQYFNQHYKVQSSDSLFAINWQPSPSDLLVSTETYCVCREESLNYPISSNYISCNLTNPSESCTSNSTEVKDVFFTECSSRKKRSTDKIETPYSPKEVRRRKRDTTFTNTIAKFDIDPVNTEAYVEPVFSWTNGWTEELARTFCELSFNRSAVFEICTTFVPEIDPTAFIEACVMDIKIGGDTSYAQVTLDTYKASCFIEATRMEVLHKSNTSTNGNGQSIFHELLGTTCPNDCSGNGTCQYGECHCHSGYFGVDCSNEANSKPSVQSESMTGLCDSSVDSCETTLIYGSGFNQDKVLCAFRVIEVTNNDTDISNSSVINQGKYMNEFCIQCILPVSKKKRSAVSSNTIATGYMISVGNGDGSGGFSDEVPFIIFDSLCYECNVTYLQCVEKSSCLASTDSTPPTVSGGTGTRLLTTDTANITGPPTTTQSVSSVSLLVTTKTTDITGNQRNTQSSSPGNDSDKSKKNVEGSGEPVLIIVVIVLVTVVGLSAVVLSVYLYKKKHYNRTQLDSYLNRSYEKEHSTVSAGSIKFAWNDGKAVPNSVPPMLVRIPSEKIIDNFITKGLEDISDD